MQTLQTTEALVTTKPLTPQQRDDLIVAWKEAKEKLDYFKASEMALRTAIASDVGMFDPSKDKGTQIYQLGSGYQLKCVRKINISAANTNGETFAVLAQLEKMGDIVKFLAKDLFKFTPELRVTKMAELAVASPEAVKLVETVLTMKPGMPELSLVEPKTKD